ncbi:MAG: FAD-dependent oxidoreductase [Chloroflexi bacterium]|nr:FAD-dependent oxidoreductase [Chloroflexota bacterium]
MKSSQEEKDERMKTNNSSFIPHSSSLPIGAVMVVGGGIAGMQASLDLAEQGFKVYLVEKNSAIGGHMAQLDKTFPTNDCAMCTISPRLVETGRHPNIEILTNSEVQDVSGQAGDFKVTVERRPRYIDINKCIACGDCVKVCPVVVPDTFNEGLALRHAAYKLYPQAVPNAFAIEKRGIAPCRDACPAHQRAQGYIALIREGRWADALRVIKMDNPFPGICGRICNHRCETACNRNLVDEPINIRALKRFVTDKVYSEPRQPVEPVEIKYPDQRVAIIGAGPCGLTAAQDVIRQGYPVTIFEAMPVAGGMLRLGVPEFRLPAEIIEHEVADITDLGIELRLNTPVTNLDDIFNEGFTSVLISVGAHEGVRLPIPGANLEGVLINTQFLKDVRLGKYETLKVSETFRVSELGKNVLVLGGGNVAIDVARTAVRLGCKVSMACLEGRDQMPAHDWEIQAALDEGIEIYNSRSFESVLGDENGRARGVECMQVSSFSFDEMGRLSVEKSPDSNHVIPCDTVIFSVGQRAGLAFIPADAGVGLTERKTIAINPNTFAATRPGVFAAGDSVSGTAFVIEAVASGHKAAESILRYLQSEALERPPKPELPVVKLTRQEIDDRIARGEIKKQNRVPLPELPIEQRIRNFAEIEGGYDDESAQREAARCLACGICSECMSCTFACGVNAIDHDMVARQETVNVGAVILAPGYQAYHAELSEEFGYGRYPNVVTSLQFERLLSASGPTMGRVHRPSDHQPPKRIAFLQCVGSRDQTHDYCSAVCCMYATKEAVIAKEHQPGLDVHVFMMDMRAFSKGYWGYFERARERYGIQYHRSRVSMIREDPRTRELILSYGDQSSVISHQLSVINERFDMVVLSVGMEISESVRNLGRRLGVELDEYGFCQTVQFNPLETSRPGIYAVGPFREPKDIPESVVEGSGAAGAAAARLSPARFVLTVQREYPEERDISQEEPRVGVFVCSCGTNIGGFVDVPAVTEYAAGLPRVVHAESNLYTCSQDSIKHISEQVIKHGLNRVVVASCTPLTHQPLFQDSIRMAGLNPYLFEMANIRNQCSWVHSNDKETATAKARDLIRAAAARAALLEAQHTVDVPVQRTALVVGGGAAGMTAALSLAEQGFPVHLVEQEAELGGNLRHVFTSSNDKDPQEILQSLIGKMLANPAIILHLNSKVVSSSGFMGNFNSTLEDRDGSRREIAHGATILATGAQEYRGPEYGYGSDPRIVTQQEFEGMLATQQPVTARNEAVSSLNGGLLPEGRNDGAERVVMIQCVGPAEKFCSRICCTVALKNAIRLKEINPKAEVVIVYRDIRAYGFKERLYTQAREKGVVFIRYDFERKPEVTSDQLSVISVKAWEPVLRKELTLHPDLLVLSMPVVPRQNAHETAARFKVPRDADGFFLEAHVKLRPVDFASDGIFMAGMAHYPKLLDETLIQAQAAAARAARVLSRETLTAGGRVAVVDPSRCTGCLTCVRICPFGVPKIRIDLTGVGGIIGAAYVEAAVCQGCGICAAECPARAIQLMHYTDVQMTAKVGALLNPIVIGEMQE